MSDVDEEKAQFALLLIKLRDEWDETGRLSWPALVALDLVTVAAKEYLDMIEETRRG